MGTQVLSPEQAKAVTKGRTPLLPAEYEEAIHAIQACVTLDEAKYWDNKADVLAAWSKIYHSNEVERQARILKLHAYRRMSDLLAETKKHRKTPDSPTKVLRAGGMSAKQVQGVMAVGKMPKADFDRVLAAEKIPTPTALIPGQLRRHATSAGGASLESLRAFHYFTERVDAKSIAHGMSPKDRTWAMRVATEVIDWLTEMTEEINT